MSDSDTFFQLDSFNGFLIRDVFGFSSSVS